LSSSLGCDAEVLGSNPAFPWPTSITVSVPGWDVERDGTVPWVAKTLDKKTVQHNVDDDILTKQIFLGLKGRKQKVGNWSDLCGSQ
jgi:hypothetical protein